MRIIGAVISESGSRRYTHFFVELTPALKDILRLMQQSLTANTEFVERKNTSCQVWDTYPCQSADLVLTQRGISQPLSTDDMSVQVSHTEFWWKWYYRNLYFTTPKLNLKLLEDAGNV